MNDAEVGQDIGSAGQDPTIPKDWGNCGSDRRKVYNLSLVVESPKHGNRWAQMFGGNWHGSGIFTASSGSYASASTGTDVALTGGTQRPNQVADPFVAGTVAANPTCTAPSVVKTRNNWFNPCAFKAQAAGTYGNQVRNSLLNPGNWNFNASLWRTFPISERLKLDFRAEAFNIFNHTEIGAPSTSINSSTAGRISSSALPRIMQLALKLTF
jgi:hypothetical protein